MPSVSPAATQARVTASARWCCVAVRQARGRDEQRFLEKGAVEWIGLVEHGKHPQGATGQHPIERNLEAGDELLDQQAESCIALYTRLDALTCFSAACQLIGIVRADHTAAGIQPARLDHQRKARLPQQQSSSSPWTSENAGCGRADRLLQLAEAQLVGEDAPPPRADCPAASAPCAAALPAPGHDRPPPARRPPVASVRPAPAAGRSRADRTARSSAAAGPSRARADGNSRRRQRARCPAVAAAAMKSWLA